MILMETNQKAARADAEEKAKAIMKEENKPENGKKKKGKKEKRKKSIQEEILSWIVTLLAAVVIASLIRAYIAEPVRVDGNSMNNTLMDGEIVLVTKQDYLRGNYQRGDIVICRYPGRMNERGAQFNLGASLALDNHTLFVKRLVALPEDTVEIAGGVLYVNGEAVPNPEKMGSVPQDYPLRQLGPDEYFVIGAITAIPPTTAGPTTWARCPPPTSWAR